MDLESLVNLDRLAVWGLGAFLIVVPGLVSRTCCKSTQLLRAQDKPCKLPDGRRVPMRFRKPTKPGEPRHVA